MSNFSHTAPHQFITIQPPFLYCTVHLHCFMFKLSAYVDKYVHNYLPKYTVVNATQAYTSLGERELSKNIAFKTHKIGITSLARVARVLLIDQVEWWNQLGIHRRVYAISGTLQRIPIEVLLATTELKGVI